MRRTLSPKPRTRTHHPETRTQNRSSLFWRAALIVLAGTLVYSNSLSAPFIFDDEVSIVQNPAIRAPGLVISQERDSPLAGRPVVGFTFALNFAGSGLAVEAYRGTNIAIHICCALILFGLIRRTLMLPRLRERFGEGGSDVAFAAALLWVIHPLTTDAVTYITQRTESLMALFYLLTVYGALRAHTSKRAVEWQVLSVIACACGMASKESMATAPVIVMLFDRIFLFDSWRQGFTARWRLYFGLAMTWWLLAYLVAPGPRSHSAGFSSGADAWVYLLNQSRMIARYVRLVFWPTDLVINYGPPVAHSLTDVLPQAAFVAALLLATMAALVRMRAVGFIGAWFFITLAPSSSVVPIATEVAAERRMYLPLMAALVGLVVMGYWLGTKQARIRRHNPLLLLMLMAAAVSLGALTIARNREYQSWLTLAERTLERWPSDVAHSGVGGELARLKRDAEALPHLRIGARTDVRARYNLGVTLYNLKRYDEAIRELDVLVRRDPNREEVPWSHRMMGFAHVQMGRWPDAIAQLRLAISMAPRDSEARRILVDAYNSYGIQLAEAHRYQAAIDQFRRGLTFDENNASLRYNLATALFDNGAMTEALAEAQRALSLNSNNADAHNLLGKLLAMRGQFKDALMHLEIAVKLKPDDPALRDDLARVRQFLK